MRLGELPAQSISAVKSLPIRLFSAALILALSSCDKAKTPICVVPTGTIGRISPHATNEVCQTTLTEIISLTVQGNGIPTHSVSRGFTQDPNQDPEKLNEWRVIELTVGLGLRLEETNIVIERHTINGIEKWKFIDENSDGMPDRVVFTMESPEGVTVVEKKVDPDVFLFFAAILAKILEILEAEAQLSQK